MHLRANDQQTWDEKSEKSRKLKVLIQKIFAVALMLNLPNVSNV